MIFEILDIALNIVIVYAVLIGVIIYIKGQKQKKRTVSLEYIRRWNEQGYQSIFADLLGGSNRQNTDIREYLYEKVKGSQDSTGLKEIERVLNFFEELAIAILFKEADEEIAKEFFIYSLITTYKVSEYAIYEIKARYRSKGIYTNYERLFGKCIKGSSLLLA